MHVDQHIHARLEQFGKTYYKVHLFLDKFASEFPGYAHRRLLHHRLGIELVVEKFGEDARKAAELHILQDTSDIIPEDWSNYGEPILLKLEDYDRQDDILKELFGEKTFNAVDAKLNALSK